MRGNSVSRCHIFPHHSHVLRPAVLRIKLEREERTGPGSELSWFALVLQQNNRSRFSSFSDLRACVGG